MVNVVVLLTARPMVLLARAYVLSFARTKVKKVGLSRQTNSIAPLCPLPLVVHDDYKESSGTSVFSSL